MNEDKAITDIKDLPAHGNYDVEIMSLDLCSAMAIYDYLRRMLGNPDMNGNPDVTLTIPFQGLKPSQVQAVEHFLDSGFMSYSIALQNRNDPNETLIFLHRDSSSAGRPPCLRQAPWNECH